MSLDSFVRELEARVKALEDRLASVEEPDTPLVPEPTPEPTPEPDTPAEPAPSS